MARPVGKVTQASMAKGTVYLFVSQAVAMACGYAIQFFLGRKLGPQDYGIYQVVLSVLVWLELLLAGVSGVIIKDVAGKAFYNERLEKRSLLYQLQLSLLVFAIALTFSFFIAEIFKMKDVGFYFRIAIIDILVLAFYHTYNALLNALKLWREQAVAITAYSFSKMILTIVLVSLNMSILGAVSSHVAASAFGFLAGFVFIRAYSSNLAWESPDGRFSLLAEEREIFGLYRLAIPFAAINLLFNLLLNVDLWVVEALVSDAAKTGYYAAAQTIAKSLYYLFVAFSFVLFPVLVESIAASDAEKTKQYINQTVRLLLMCLVPISTLFALTSSALVTLIYGKAYTGAGEALTILSIGYCLIPLIYAYINTFIAGSMYKTATGITAAIVFADIGFCAWLVPWKGLPGAALATLFASLLGLLLCIISIQLKYKARFPLVSLLRITICSSAMVPIFIFIRDGILVIVLYLFALVLYLGLLIFTREAGEADYRIIRGLFKAADEDGSGTAG